MRAVDTNVLVRLISRDDARQVAAADAFIAPGAWVSHLVLVEALSVLSSVYRLRSVAVATAVEMLLNHKNLAVQDSDVVESALVRYRKSPSVGFPDCLVLEVARKAGHLPLGTFGRRLGRQAGAQRL